MILRYAISIIIILSSLNLFGQAPSNDRHWQLAWEDNFNSIDTTIWEVVNNFDHYGEPQMYRMKNVSVRNGNLMLTVKEEVYREHNYTSGWVESKKDYNTQFGYIESRIKLPYGHGFWPAFWTFVGSGVKDNTNAAEIDIFEMLGGAIPNPNTISTNIHLSYPNNNPYRMDIKPKNFNYTDWHTYGIEWSPSMLIWYVDGVPVRFFPNHGIIDPVRIILNLAIEPSYTPNSNTPFPSEMRVDFVKVYELKSDVKTIIYIFNYNFSTTDKKSKKGILMRGSSKNPNLYLRIADGVLINEDSKASKLFIDISPRY